MSGFLSLIGWTFLPNLATNWVQAIYYGVAIRAGDPKPQPGTARYAEHRRRIHILVVSLYLLYTIYEADYEIRRAGSFYSDLSLTPAATEREVKARFRRLAALYHPDKVLSSSGGAAAGEAANAFFIRLKLASETLTDPARRFAYDRFGPDVVAWHRCVTVRDYVSAGLQGLVPFYVGAGGFMYLLGLLGYLAHGRAWRWLTFFALLVFEAHVVTRPHHPVVFDAVVNPLVARLSPLLMGGGATAAAAAAPYLPFQAVQLARKLSVTLYIALSQIGPLLSADATNGRRAAAASGDQQQQEAAMLGQALDRLDKVGRALGDDAANLLAMELCPFSGDREAMDSVRGKVKEWLVQNTIRSDPIVRDALGNSLRKRRVDAPFGAQGTR